MLLMTKHFGEIEYDEEAVLIFEAGLPGFWLAKRYILIQSDEVGDPFCWLQCLDDEELAFVLMDVKQVLPDYNPQVDPAQTESLGEGILDVYNIAVVPEDLQDMRVNLKAPVMINHASGRGKQVLADQDYSLRYYIFEELDKITRLAAKE